MVIAELGYAERFQLANFFLCGKVQVSIIFIEFYFVEHSEVDKLVAHLLFTQLYS